MRLEDYILNLVSGIDDPAIRISIARTIHMMRDALAFGKADEKEVLKDLTALVYEVINLKEPFIPEEEKKEKAKKIANAMIKALKMSSMNIMTFRKYSF